MTQTFPIRFGFASWFYTILGIGPSVSAIEISTDTVFVKMGWAFRASIPRTSIVNVAHDRSRVLGWGVHGWNGRWLVNGMSQDIVRVTINPPARAHVCLVPVNLRQLRVSVTDPDDFIATLQQG